MTTTEKLDKIHGLHKHVLGAIAQYNLECEAAIASQPDADEAYKKGLEEAWALVRKIELPVRCGGFTKKTLYEIFGDESPDGIFSELTASEALANLRAYEERQKAEDEAVKVGDEVESVTDPRIKIIVTWITSGEGFSGISSTDGHAYNGCYPDRWRKTGRHFPEIAAVLEQMKGE